MNNDLMIKRFEDVNVFFMEDGWFNASNVAKKFDKRPNDWLRLASTKKYIQELMDELKITENELVIIRRGNSLGGTWMHFRLCKVFLRWLNVEISIENFIVDGVLDCVKANFHANEVLGTCKEITVKDLKIEELYVVLFDTGMIKVGKGFDAKARVVRHARQASIFDRHVLKFFIEKNPKITEEALIAFCIQHGTLCNGKEYFKGIDYSDVVEFIKPKIKRKDIERRI